MKESVAIKTVKGDYLIRLIEADDSPSIRDIIVDTLLEFGASGDGFACNDAETQDMYSHYQGDGLIYFVLERVEDGTIVGGGGVAPLTGSDVTCEFVKMYYLQDVRGLGLGKKLLEICIDEARNMGYQTMYLETLDNMQAARGLYEKYGFTQIDGPIGQTGHCGCDTFYMRAL